MHTKRHTFDTMPKTKSSTAPRRNVYFRNPTIFNALCAAIKKKILRARSASERIEDLITADLKRIVPRMRKKGIEIPEALIGK